MVFQAFVAAAMMTAAGSTASAEPRIKVSVAGKTLEVRDASTGGDGLESALAGPIDIVKSCD